MTPATTPLDTTLPPLGALAGRNGLELAPTSTGAVWTALGAGFAQFFAPPASAADGGECTMDSPTL